MKRVNNYKDFINEEFFKRIFNRSKKITPKQNSRIDDCVNTVVQFLKENDIKDWNDFINCTKFDKYVIDSIIDKSVDNMSELEEVRFRIRIELSDRPQLIEYKNELEEAEEYEKCAMIVKKLSR